MQGGWWGPVSVQRSAGAPGLWLGLEVRLLRVCPRVPHKHPHLKGEGFSPQPTSNSPVSCGRTSGGAEQPFPSLRSLHDERAQALRDERPELVWDGPHRAPGPDIHQGRHREGCSNRRRWVCGTGASPAYGLFRSREGGLGAPPCSSAPWRSAVFVLCCPRESQRPFPSICPCL